MADYILDTDICSYIMLNSSNRLLENLEARKNDDLHIAAVTYAELLFGALRKDSRKIFRKISLVMRKVKILSFDENAAKEYAKIRSTLEKNGTPIGNMDMLIASCAVANNAILVTNNIRHFSRIDDLQVQNWTE
jgi:tRNA(fMet)-specific endonuclease VapC